MLSGHLENNKKLVKNWINYKLQGQGNPFKDLASEVVFYIPGANNNPLFVEFIGIKEVKRFFQLLQEKLLQKKLKQTFEVTECIAEGNRVVVLLEEIFTVDHSPSESNRNIAAWIFEINNQQKIISLRCYDDTLMSSAILV